MCRTKNVAGDRNQALTSDFTSREATASIRRMTEAREYVCRLSEEEKAYVAANLNETDQERSMKIAEMRKWILENDDMHARIDDFSILRFLRACKFNLEKTKWKLRNYHVQRSAIPEWYANRDPFLPELQELFNLGVFLPLRQLHEGKMIVIIRTAVHDPSRHKQSDVLKAGLMILDLAIREHESVTINGIIGILDMAGMTYAHVLQLPPHVIKKLVHAWQGCYPLRIRSLDFVNAPTLVNVVLNIFRGFMSPKLRRRVHVYGRGHGTRTFYQKLPASIMPLEYKGTDGTIQTLADYWKRIAEENKQWFAEDEKYKVVSSK